MNEFGNNVKELREAKKMSQPLLADRLGITRSAISSYENGTRLPSYDILLKMAKIFNVTIDYLLGNSSNKDYIDVSGLDSEQRNLIETLIAHFGFHNYLVSHTPSGTVKNYKEAQAITNDLLMTMATGILADDDDDNEEE